MVRDVKGADKKPDRLEFTKGEALLLWIVASIVLGFLFLLIKNSKFTQHFWQSNFEAYLLIVFILAWCVLTKWISDHMR